MGVLFEQKKGLQRKISLLNLIFHNSSTKNPNPIPCDTLSISSRKFGGNALGISYVLSLQIIFIICNKMPHHRLSEDKKWFCLLYGNDIRLSEFLMQGISSRIIGSNCCKVLNFIILYLKIGHNDPWNNEKVYKSTSVLTRCVAEERLSDAQNVWLRQFYPHEEYLKQVLYYK